MPRIRWPTKKRCSRITRDECAFRIVRALRDAGHDVTAVVEIRPGASDEEVIALARQEHRIFITEDRDFGQLVYAAGRPLTGVIYLRFRTAVRTTMAASVLDLITTQGEKLFGRFAVLQPGRIRIGGDPSP